MSIALSQIGRKQVHLGFAQRQAQGRLSTRLGCAQIDSRNGRGARWGLTARVVLAVTCSLSRLLRDQNAGCRSTVAALYGKRHRIVCNSRHVLRKFHTKFIAHSVLVAIR